MLTPAEKRFIRYWEEQRTGGKIKYYLLYILIGTFIAILCLFFLYSLWISPIFTLEFGLVAIAITAFVAVTLITVITWHRNEKKFRNIIQREIQEGQMKDESEGSV